MNDTMDSILVKIGYFMAILATTAAFIQLAFIVEKSANEYATRQCRCQCASEYVPPVTAPRVWPDAGVKGGSK